MLNIKKSSLTKDFNNSSKIGVIYIRCSRRNVFCTLIDPSEKQVKFSCSSGVAEVSQSALKFNSNYFKSKILSQYFIQKIKEFGFGKLRIIVNGLGTARVVLISALRNSNLQIIDIQDATLIPHNGCRGPKQRRKKLRTRLSFKIKKLVSPAS